MPPLNATTFQLAAAIAGVLRTGFPNGGISGSGSSFELGGDTALGAGYVGSGSSSSLAAFAIGTGTKYHVKPASIGGSDAADGLSFETAFATINRGLGAARTAGCTVLVYSTGTLTTYTDTTRSNQYVPFVQTSETIDASLAFNGCGTASNPITLMAAPGHEGLVRVDGQQARAGIIGARWLSAPGNGLTGLSATTPPSYCQVYGIRFENCLHTGIGSQGYADKKNFDPTYGTVGWRVENNCIKNTYGQNGANNAAIGPWGSKDWVINNNYIDTVTILAPSATQSCGIMAFGIVNALICNNRIKNVDYGIFWKDHFYADGTTGTPLFESEVRYNHIECRRRGFLAGLMGTGSEPAGNNYVHHNIIRGLSFDEGAAIHQDTGGSGAGFFAGYLRAEFNTIHCAATNAWGILFNDAQGLYAYGNIIVGAGLHIVGLGTGTKFGYVGNDVANGRTTDYNLFDAAFRAVLGLYGSYHFFDSLAAWKAALDADYVMLNMNNPDPHSLATATAALCWVNAAGGDYTNKVGSPAIGMMPDGSNAGCYQRNTEIIGITSAYSAGT